MNWNQGNTPAGQESNLRWAPNLMLKTSGWIGSVSSRRDFVEDHVVEPRK